MRKKTGSRTGGWAGNLVSVEVGRRLRVVPLWERYCVDAERINLVIEPGASFGAGDHPTTVMALGLLEEAMTRLKRELSAPSMLDAGTGTGILAIAAKALGSGMTVAFDIDGAAIFVAQRNVRLNAGLFDPQELGPPVNFFVGDAAVVRGTFDVVAANLAAPVLVRSAEVLTRLCGEYLVLSGIADEMEAAVFAAYEALSMELIAREHRERWNAGLLRNRSQKKPRRISDRIRAPGDWPLKEAEGSGTKPYPRSLEPHRQSTTRRIGRRAYLWASPLRGAACLHP